MGTDFQSFNQSPLGAFIQSPLSARGDDVVAILGDLFVVHTGTTFDGITTNGFAFYNASTELWEAVPTTTNLDGQTSSLIVSGNRLFCASTISGTQRYFMWGLSGGNTKFFPGSESVWRDDFGYSSNWPSSNSDGYELLDLQGDLIIARNELSQWVTHVGLSGTPTASNNIVKHNPLLGYFEPFGAVPENILVDSMITHGAYIIVAPVMTVIPVVLSAAGYVNCISSDINKTVAFKETGDIQTDTGAILTVDSTPSDNTFTITVDGQTESVTGTVNPQDTATALVLACTNSLNPAFQNVAFLTVGASSNIQIVSKYVDVTFTSSLTVTGAGTGSVTNFTSSTVSDTDTYATGTLKRFNNTTRTWYVDFITAPLNFFNDYADVDITSGTGAGVYENVTPAYDLTAFYHSTDGATWTGSAIDSKLNSGAPFPTLVKSSGSKLFVGCNEDNGLLVDGVTEGELFEWDIAADTYTRISNADLVTTQNLVEIGSSVYFRQGLTSDSPDGIYKLTGTTLTRVSPDNGADDIGGIRYIETRGSDLIVGTDADTIGITKPPNNFYVLSGEVYSEYLGSSGTAAASDVVSNIIYPEKNGALITSGVWAGLSVISVSPASGSPSGGDNITITGSGFTASTTFTIGGSAVTNLNFVSASSVTCDTPSGAGMADIVATEGLESDTLSNGFTYVSNLSITSVTPNTGSTAGGLNVTVSGTGFTASTTVNFRATPGTSIVFVNSTTITCDTPSHGAGTFSVTVIDGVDSDVLFPGFTFS